MTTKTVKCIVCPVGCDIAVRGEGADIEDISGNTCSRGEQYARDEFTDPRRMLTSVVKAEGYRLPVVSVRTDKPIPKNRIFDCMEALSGMTAKAPFAIGDVLAENILGTGANIIITKN